MKGYYLIKIRLLASGTGIVLAVVLDANIMAVMTARATVARRFGIAGYTL